MTTNQTSPTILVADDESNIRLLLRTALETEGYTVSEACDGRAALEAIGRSVPDLMILDLNMPTLDGLAVLEQLHPLPPGSKPRVIVLTAHGSIPAAVKATRLGAADFLEKPVTPTELRAAVRGVLDDTDGAVSSTEGHSLVLERVRKSLRLMDLSTAETMLAISAERRDRHAAVHFNLLGVLAECQHRPRLARRYYGMAIDADEAYEPATNNFRRFEELGRTGRSDRPVLLGDEPGHVWAARLPKT